MRVAPRVGRTRREAFEEGAHPAPRRRRPLGGEDDFDAEVTRGAANRRRKGALCEAERNVWEDGLRLCAKPTDGAVEVAWARGRGACELREHDIAKGWGELLVVWYFHVLVAGALDDDGDVLRVGAAWTHADEHRNVLVERGHGVKVDARLFFARLLGREGREGGLVEGFAPGLEHTRQLG